MQSGAGSVPVCPGHAEEGSVIATDVDDGSATKVTLRGTTPTFERTDEAASPGLYLGRGLLDVQVNGFAGFDVNGGDLTTEGFESLVRALRAEGVTRFFPTVVTAAPEHMRACLRRVAEAHGASASVARAVPGIHLEGPFLSKVEGARGAHPEEHLKDADPALFDDLQEAAGGLVRLVTLAPEVPDAHHTIAHLARQGVTVAIGHTVADGAAIADAIAAGARMSTHLGNGVPAQLPRHPNVIWEQLSRDELAASAIFDGHHLPDGVMRVLYRVKGAGRLILTSDSVALARQRPGVYEDQLGGTVELRGDGRLTMRGSDYLAGSASSLLDGVRTAWARLGIESAEAVRMASRTPSEIVGLEPTDDRIVLRFADGRVTVAAVFVDGELVAGEHGDA